MALALGKSLSQIGELSSREVSRWRAYARLGPFGERRADWRAAQAQRATFMVSGAFKPEDLPSDRWALSWRLDEPENAAPVEAQIAAAELATAARAVSM